MNQPSLQQLSFFILFEFERKLKKAKDDGHISSRDYENLDAALEAGHASIHRGYKPDSETLSIVVDIVEHVLHFLVLEGKSESVKQKVPKRNKVR